MAKELDKVLETGFFLFKLPMDGRAQMILEYIPSSTSQGSSMEDIDGGTTTHTRVPSFPTSRLEQLKSGDLDGGLVKKSKSEQWTSEQIGDFVRKLGFMDTEREGGEKIKHFRHISFVSYLCVFDSIYDIIVVLQFCHFWWLDFE